MISDHQSFSLQRIRAFHRIRQHQSKHSDSPPVTPQLVLLLLRLTLFAEPFQPCPKTLRNILVSWTESIVYSTNGS
jgi:hypothetical protein